MSFLLFRYCRISRQELISTVFPEPYYTQAKTCLLDAFSPLKSLCDLHWAVIPLNKPIFTQTQVLRKLGLSPVKDSSWNNIPTLDLLLHDRQSSWSQWSLAVLAGGISIMNAASVSIWQSAVQLRVSVVIGVLITHGFSDEGMIEMFRNISIVSYVSCIHSNFPFPISYFLAQWFPRPCFLPEEVEVFNLLPVWDAPSTRAKASNCSSAVIELSVGLSQPIRVMWSHRRTARQLAPLPLITAAGSGPD